MSSFVSFASSGGANQNLNNSYETLGYGTAGTGTLVTANASANTKGSYSASLGTTAADWAGFYLHIGSASASTVRYIVDVSLDNGSTVHVPNLYLEPGQTVGPTVIWIPLFVASGAVIVARIQASTGAATLRVGVQGVVDNSQSAPMYTTMTALNIDTAATRAGTADIAFQDNAGTTYGAIVASTGAEYKAFLFSPGSNGTNPGTSQAALLKFATGAAASEVEFGDWPIWVMNAAAPYNVDRSLAYFERTIAASTRLSVKPLVATPGTDNLRMAAYGFS